MKFEFRYESLKSTFRSIPFVYNLIIECLKNKKNYPRKCFCRKKEKKTGLKFNHWLAIIGLEELGPGSFYLPCKFNPFHSFSCRLE